MIEYFILGSSILILVLIIVLLKLSNKKVKPINMEKIEEKSKLEEVIEALENTDERPLTSYEQDQEENAIISYQELVKAVEAKKGHIEPKEPKKQASELVSIVNEIENPEFAEIIEKGIVETDEEISFQVNDEVKNIITKEANLQVIEPKIESDIKEETNVKIEIPEIENTLLETSDIKVDNVLVDAITTKEDIEEKKFKSTEFISPIFGKDKDNVDFLNELKDFRSSL